MKILLIVTKAEVGGAQMSVLNLARELKARGHEITVAFGDGDFLPAELDREKISYTRFKWLKRTHNPLANIFFILEIKKFFADKNFAVVHFNSSNALFGAIGVKLADGSVVECFFRHNLQILVNFILNFLANTTILPKKFKIKFPQSRIFGTARKIIQRQAHKKIKTVFTFRGMSMLDEHYKKGGLLKIIYFWLFKFLLLFIDQPVFISRENLEKFGRGRLVKNGFLVYNGLDPARLEFLPREESRKILSDKISILLINRPHFEEEELRGKYVIGSIGRLEYAKNYEFLINIFPEILKIKNEAIAVIIGEGPEEENLRALIKSKGLEDKIFLLGNIPYASRFINGFDLFVLPSRYEGLSITLIESLFAGARILTTNVGGNSETAGCEEELFELDNQKDFLAKFEKLQNFEIQAIVDANNQKQAQKFILSKTVDGYEKAYK